MAEKLLVRVIKIGLFATLIIPFITLDFFVYPSVFGQATIFRFVVELLLIFYVPLIIFHPAYRPDFRSNITRGLVIYFIALLIAAIFSADRAISFWGTLARDTGLVTLLHFLAYYLMLVSVLRRDDWRRFLRASVASGAVMAIIIIAQSLGWIAFFVDARPYGTLGNSGFAGAYLLFSVYFTILLFVKERQKIIHACLIASGALLFWALIANATRSVFIGIIASALVFLTMIPLLKIKTSQKIYRTIALAFACGALFITATYVNILPAFMYEDVQLLSRIRAISFSNNIRVLAWEAGLSAFYERPIFGYGPENFSIAFNKNFSARLGDMSRQGFLTQFDNAHNKFVELLATSGIIGTAAYVFLLLALAKIFWRHRGDKEVAILALLLVAYEAHLMFSFDTLSSYMLFMITLALVHAHTRTDKKISAHPLSKKTAAALIISSFAVIAISMFHTVIKPAYASPHIVAAVNANDVENIFQEYRAALSVGSVYNHDFVRDFAEGALSRVPSYNAKQEEMYRYTAEQLEKYDNPYDWEKQFLFARLYNILCDKDARYCGQALDKLALAERLSPNRSHIFTEGFVVYYKMGEYKNAQEKIERAIELGYNPDKAASIPLLIGKTYQNNREYETALFYYKKALAVDPSNAKAQKAIEEITSIMSSPAL